MKCQRCEEDSAFTDLLTQRFLFVGFGGDVYSLKRNVCHECFEIYAEMDHGTKQYMKANGITEVDIKL